MDIGFDLFARYFLGKYFTFIALFYSARLIMNRTGKTLTYLGKVKITHWYGHMTFRVYRLAIYWKKGPQIHIGYSLTGLFLFGQSNYTFN